MRRLNVFEIQILKYVLKCIAMYFKILKYVLKCIANTLYFNILSCPDVVICTHKGVFGYPTKHSNKFTPK